MSKSKDDFEMINLDILPIDFADFEMPATFFISGSPKQKLRFDLLRLARDQMGVAKYGPLNPATDQRNLLAEAVQECADLVNYLDYFCWQVHFSRSAPKLKERIIGKARELARQVECIGQNLLALELEADND